MFGKNAHPWFIVINPSSGGGKSARDWPQIAALLRQADLKYQAIFTEYPGHATQLIAKAIRKGFRKVLAVGGDGTANEVINGLFSQTHVLPSAVTFGMIPVGTGNDWGRTIGIPVNYPAAVQALVSGKTMAQDVGLARFFRDDAIQKRYFLNVAGMGYDALVADQTNRLKQKGRGKPLWYLWGLLLCLIKYRHTRVKLEVDNTALEDDIFSLSVGIGKYNGGGMMQLPAALPDDGLYDVTVIKKIGKLEVLRNVRHLYNGTFINHPKVMVFRGKKVSVSSQPQICLEVDGELVGHSRAEYEIIPGGLTVVVA